MELSVERIEMTFPNDSQKPNIVYYHNLHMYNRTFDNAYASWLLHTQEFTPESFCLYVRSFGNDYLCMQEDEFRNYLDSLNLSLDPPI